MIRAAAYALLRSLFGDHLRGEFSDGVVRYTVTVDELVDWTAETTALVAA
jgi:hypothetical protein